MMTSVMDRSELAAALTRRRLPAGASFLLLGSIVVTLLASSSAPTPLYPVYQAEWGFSAITTTVVFGAYAIAVLVALLTVGSLSDYLGRRPVLLVALVVQAATMWVFATAGGVPQLLVARTVQGLVTGAALGAVGAGLLDLDRVRGTVANAVAPMFGTGAGGLLGGLFVQFLPVPTRLVFIVLSVLFVAQAVGVALMPETTPGRPGALASLRPVFGVPPAARRPLLVAAPVLFAAWGLGGLYLALGPALARLTVHNGPNLLGGLLVFLLAGTAAVTVLVARNVEAVRMMTAGILGLIAGVGLSLIAIEASVAWLYFISLAVVGSGFGATLQGAIRTVLPAALPHQRAGVLSLVYVVSYLGFGLPAVIAGVLVVYGGGLRTTAIEYGLVVIALAALALVGLRRTAGQPSSLAPDASAR
jgi:predicted MFS family arabinose efflux permease